MITGGVAPYTVFFATPRPGASITPTTVAASGQGFDVTSLTTYLTFASFVCSAIAFAVVIRASVRLTPRGRAFLTIGIVAPIAWGSAFIAFIFYAISTLE